MHSPNSCPDAFQLKALLDDTLPEKNQAEVNQHLEECETCRQALERLAANSLVWSETAKHLKQATPPEPALEEVIEACKAESTGEALLSEPAAQATLSLNLLEPSDRPGALGRLGQYDILEITGQGGMGLVLKAFDNVLQRVAAIKVMAPALATSATARKRFIREARAAAAVSHEHVVAIYGVNEAGPLPYLVMEYVPGVSLQQWMDRNGPLELKEILRIGMQAASGLAAAHAQGLIHRDIKPANILLENGVARVKITDFGLARAMDDASLTQSGVLAGTPQYMAPEQANGEALDHRADLFSLGSVLYAICTGRPPFRASTTMAVLKRVCEDRAHPIREINPDVPEWLTEIIDTLHQKKPDDRFGSAAEVAEVLGQFLAHVQQPTLTPPPFPRVNRNPVSLRNRVSDPAPVTLTPAGLRRAAQGPGLRWAAAAALLFVIGGLGVTEAFGVTKVVEYLADTVLRIKTSAGTLVVEIDDPQVKVSVDADGEELVITGAGAHEIRLRPGQHQLKTTRDGAKVREDFVTITKNQKQIVKVSREPATTTTTAVGPTLLSDYVSGPIDLRVTLLGKERLRWQDKATLTTGAAEEFLDAVRARLKVDPAQKLAIAIVADADTAYAEVEKLADRLHQLGVKQLIHSVRSSAPHGPTMTSPPRGPMTEPAVSTIKPAQPGTVAARTMPPKASSIGRRALPGSSDAGQMALPSAGFTGARPQGQPAPAGPAALATLKAHADSVVGLAFSPNGRILATVDKLGRLKLWDVAKRAEWNWALKVEGGVRSATFAPDGRLIIVSGEGKVQTWQPDATPEVPPMGLAPHAEPVLFFPLRTQEGVAGVTFSPDGKRLAVSSDRLVFVGDVGTGDNPLILRGHEGTLRGVTFSPDGQVLASGGTDNTIRLWDMRTGRELRQMIDPAFTPRSLAFDAQGGRLYTAGDDGTVRVWDTRTGQRAMLWNPPFLTADAKPEARAPVTCIVYSPDGKMVATGHSDGVVRLWKADTWWTPVGSERRADAAPLAAGAPTIQQSRALAGHKHEVWAVAYSPDGRTLASVSGIWADDPGEVGLWDVATGKLQALTRAPRGVRCVAFAPGGKTLATGSYDGSVYFFDANTGVNTLMIRAHEGLGVNSIAFSPDGRTLATGGLDNFIKLWDVEERREIARFPEQPAWVISVAFSPDGRLLASCLRDGGVRIWDVAKREVRASWQAHEINTEHVTFSPDGKQLATAGWDGKVKLWEAGTWKELATLAGHTGAVWYVSFSPDGKLLAIGAGPPKPTKEEPLLPGEIRVYDVGTRKELSRRIQQAGQVVCVVFAPDGRTLATASWDGTVKLWDIFELRQPVRPAPAR